MSLVSNAGRTLTRCGLCNYILQIKLYCSLIKKPVKLLTLLSCCIVSRHSLSSKRRDSFRDSNVKTHAKSDVFFERNEDSMLFEQASFLRAKILRPISWLILLSIHLCCSSSVLSRSTIGKTRSYPTERKIPYIDCRPVQWIHLLLKYAFPLDRAIKWATTLTRLFDAFPRLVDVDVFIIGYIRSLIERQTQSFPLIYHNVRRGGTLHDFHFDGITHRERSTLVCSRVRVPGMIDQVYTGLYFVSIRRDIKFSPYVRCCDNTNVSNVTLKRPGKRRRSTCFPFGHAN